jgi:hypothetical protein
MAKDPNAPSSKPPKSPDSHGGAGLKPMSQATRVHRLGKIGSARQFTEQSKAPKLSTPPVKNPQPQMMRQQNRQVLGNFHQGGKVRKSGLYNLKRGETVKRSSKKA